MSSHPYCPAFLHQSPAPDRHAIFCFPQAGCDAASFARWQPYLPETIQILPVTLPGRGRRLNEVTPETLPALCDALFRDLSPYVMGSFSLVGSSMGAWIAFELARRFEEAGQPPQLVMALTASAPDQPRNLLDLENSKTPAQDLARFNPGFAEALAYPELVELVMPAIKRDFAACARYHATPDDPIRSDLLVIAGAQDRVSPPPAMQPWTAFTRGRCTFEVLAGGHDLYETQAQELAQILGARLSKAPPAAANPGTATYTGE